ncbi:hypothetical protein F7P10_19685 [Actinomadura sp. WMMB 499]|nr:hypothetical protein F7P10_19685 [Actinomadura sp. WMMB 499]
MMQRGARVGVLLAVLAAAVAGLSVLFAPAAEAEPEGRVVVVGVPGLLWSDVDRENTPALWGMVEDGSGAALSVRTTRRLTCPTDGWLSVSAGQRARLPDGNCGLPATPGRTPEGGAVAPGWQAIAKDNAGTGYHARVGLLGDAVHAAGGCTLAVGPGAVFGLADGNGRVDRYAGTPGEVRDWSCPVSAVAVDDVFRAYVDAGVDADGEQAEPGADARVAAVAAADRRVGQVLASVPDGTTVLLAGLADASGDPHLHVAAATGAEYGGGYLTSSATRQRGLVTLTDLTATALEELGLERPDAAVGSAWTAEPSEDTAAERVEGFDDDDVAAQGISAVQTSFYWVLFAAQLVAYGAAALALRRLGGDRRSRSRILGGTRVIALFGGAVPAATFLTGLLPWWRAPNPTVMLVITVLGFGALLTGVALAGPWRRSVVLPGLVITAVTALVLALDVMTGSNLQLNTLMGYTALIAGRFYGFGNQAFALFAVATILTAAWLTEFPLRRNRKAVAAGTVAVIGVAAVAVDGLPAWGSDFGGVLAMVPAFAMLGMLVTGRRVSPVRLGLFCAAGAVVVLGISYWNAQSENPTHLGRFWQDLVAGEAWGVVVRKFNAMIGSLGYWAYTVALIAAVIFLFFVLVRPTRWRVSLLGRAYEHSPTMRPAVICALAVGLIGMLVNDSGVVILSVAVSLATPLMLAAGLRSLEIDLNAGRESPGPEEPPRESTGRPSAERS